MTYPQYLSAEDIARLYLGWYSVAADASPFDLEDSVIAYLKRSGFEHRVQDAFTIAAAVVRLAKEAAPAPLPTPETERQQADVREGFGDRQVPDVGSMSVAEWARVRQSEFGMGQPGLAEFLGGRR